MFRIAFSGVRCCVKRIIIGYIGVLAYSWLSVLAILEGSLITGFMPDWGVLSSKSVIQFPLPDL